MKNKQLYLLPLIPVGLFMQNVASASPLVSIGENVDVFFNGSSSLRWTSNVFRDQDEEVDDLFWTLSPGFEINVGRGLSNLDLSIITRYDILRYIDRSESDTELFSLTAQGSYRGSRLDLSGSVSFSERDSNTGDISRNQEFIESYNTGFNLDGEYRLSPKFSFGSGFSYSQLEYQNFTDRFADTESYTVPFDVFYELTPKVDLSVGYSYTRRDVDATLSNPAYSSESAFYNVGLRGNLLPKLSGFFRVGYSTREDERGGADESGTVGLNLGVTWNASAKTTVGVTANRGFGVGGEGDSTVNTSVGVNASYSLTTHVSATTSLGYTLRESSNTDRTDHQYNLGAALVYAMNEHWRFSAGYTYNENDASDADRSYQSHGLDFTVTLRY